MDREEQRARREGSEARNWVSRAEMVIAAQFQKTVNIFWPTSREGF